MKIQAGSQHRHLQKRWRSLVKTGRGCPSLVGGRPAKSVVRNGRVGSNPTPRAIEPDKKNLLILILFVEELIDVVVAFCLQ